MNLSKETINKLKNFAEINSNLLIKPGTKLSTLSAGKALAADAIVTETFNVPETGFGIYDLNEFLGIMSLFENPNLEFSNKFVTISEGKTNIKYFAADPSVLTYATKDIKFPEAEINFTMQSNILQSIRKVASVLKTTDISIVGDGTEITIQVGDKKNATANAYNSTIGLTDKEFVVNLKVDNLKLLPGDYDVSISSKKISRFSTTDMTYFVAIEADSTFSF